jgi:hypothetical protein
VAVKVAVEKVANVDFQFGSVINREWNREGFCCSKRDVRGFQEWGGRKFGGVWQEMPTLVPTRVLGKVVGEAACNFAEAASATGVGSAAKSEAEGGKEEKANNNYRRYGSGQGVVEAWIPQFPLHL